MAGKRGAIGPAADVGGEVTVGFARGIADVLANTDWRTLLKDDVVGAFVGDASGASVGGVVRVLLASGTCVFVDGVGRANAADFLEEAILLMIPVKL